MTDQTYSQTRQILVEGSSIQTMTLLDASYHKLKKSAVRLMFYYSTKEYWSSTTNGYVARGRVSILILK